MAGRREQLRAALEQSIRDAALSELRRSGPSNLSLREVARGANISPGGLYRYVDGRTGLLELLIADGFERFGQAIGRALDETGPEFLDRAIALGRTYRQWARDHPEQFALILGTPVAGFRAQPGGVTDQAVRRFGMPMLSLFVVAHTDGQLAPLGPAGETIDLSVFDSAMGIVPAGVVDIAMRSWARIHGIVLLEACGHLAWTGRNVDDLLVAEATAIVTSFGRAGAPDSALSAE
ncbi:MAG: TetR/AcrR family transcriptional regulator [Nocardioides sp.]